MNEPKPDLATHERLLKDVRQEVRNLQVMQMRPGQQRRSWRTSRIWSGRQGLR